MGARCRSVGHPQAGPARIGAVEQHSGHMMSSLFRFLLSNPRGNRRTHAVGSGGAPRGDRSDVFLQPSPGASDDARETSATLHVLNVAITSRQKTFFV